MVAERNVMPRLQFNLKTIFALTTAVAVLVTAWPFLPFGGFRIAGLFLLATAAVFAATSIGGCLFMWLLWESERVLERCRNMNRPK
jgi:hypothetical protein